MRYGGGQNPEYFFATNNSDVCNIRDIFCVKAEGGRYLICRDNLDETIEEVRTYINNLPHRKASQNKKRRILNYLNNNGARGLLERYQYVNATATERRVEKHAEVYLCEKVQQLREEEQGQRVVTSIYGNKRPCVTCAVRMKTDKITHYNRNHGRLFLNTTPNLTRPQACDVVNKLFAGTYITRTRDCDGNVYTTTHHDTDSEEECQ